MQQRLIELHQQRGRLLERAAMQRNLLARQVLPLKRVFSFSERVQEVAQQARSLAMRHPWALAAVLGALVVLRPRTVLRWGQRSLALWRGWRTVSGVVPAVLAKYVGRR